MTTMDALLDRLEQKATTIQTLQEQNASLRSRLEVSKTVTERLQTVYQNVYQELNEEKKTTKNLQNKINEINERNELQNKINEKRATLTEVLKQEVVDANAAEGSTV